MENVVAALGAIQAQDYAGALWAVGLRTGSGTEAAVEQALSDRKIIRTWPMRGTLHFVAAADVRWMLALQRERIIAKAAARHRQLELDETTFARAAELLMAALHGEKKMTRSELYEVLVRAGISTAGQRGYHILWRLGLEALICFGTPQSKQQTFVLLDEWVPDTRILEREEALEELAHRYFTSRGPATVQDFIWWSGLRAADARAGLEMSASHLEKIDVDGNNYWMPRESPPRGSGRKASQLYLLPGFDEYLLGYKDRTAALVPRNSALVVPARNGVMKPVIVLDGVVAGTWKRAVRTNDVLVTASPFNSFSRAEARAFEAAAARYGEFLGMHAEVSRWRH